jgi:hypothetical protein
VTYNNKTQEFEMSHLFHDTLHLVRSYYNVRGGGLLLHGRGAVVNAIIRGASYELVGGL